MDNLRSYVDQVRAQGWDDQRIRNSLQANGWPDEQITVALGQGSLSAPASAPAPGNEAAAENPEKSYLVALLLSHFLGGIAADRFYLGKMGTAVIKLLTFGGLGIWTIIDTLLIAFGRLTAKDDPRKLEGYDKNKGWVKILAIILIILNVLVGLGILLVLVFSTVAGVQHRTKTEQQLQAQQQLLEQEKAEQGATQ